MAERVRPSDGLGRRDASSNPGPCRGRAVEADGVPFSLPGPWVGAQVASLQSPILRPGRRLLYPNPGEKATSKKNIRDDYDVSTGKKIHIRKIAN